MKHGPRRHLLPSLLDHAAAPTLGQRKGLGASRAVFGEEDLTVDDNAKFPVRRPRDQCASRLAVQAPHHPQRTNVI
jgi:hypothetical protein